MKKLTPLIILLALSACGPSREQTDGKLLDACKSALTVVYDEGDVLDVQEKSFASSKLDDGTQLRTVKIRAYYTHQGGAVEEKNYSCAFSETSGLFGYNPHFHNMDRDGQHYGNFDGELTGDLQALIKINEVMDGILR